jgi:hypothetical protein
MRPVVYIFWIVYTNIFDIIWWNIILSSRSNSCMSCQGIYCNDTFMFYTHLLDPYIYIYILVNGFSNTNLFTSYRYTPLSITTTVLPLAAFVITIFLLASYKFVLLYLIVFCVKCLLCLLFCLWYFLVSQSNMHCSVKMCDSFHCINH